MKVIIQRVLHASASVDGKVVSSIGKGLCLLLGINNNDTHQEIEYIVNKVLNLRLFEDANGKKWEVGVRDAGLEILCLSQFTLCCVLKGNKPDFHQAMPGDRSNEMFQDCVKRFRDLYSSEAVKSGLFGAYSQILLENDGPVTIDLESPVLPPQKERKVPGNSKQKTKSAGGAQPVNTGTDESVTSEGAMKEQQTSECSQAELETETIPQSSQNNEKPKSV